MFRSSTSVVGVRVSATPLTIGDWRYRLADWRGLGIVIDGLDGLDHTRAAPADYVNEVLLTPEHRDAFFALVDRAGLVVCKNVGGDDSLHRGVRAKSSRGRLSQGEYFHHDGCAGPTKPRVVEIRCPYQEVERHTSTAIAPFPEVVVAMLNELPARLRNDEIAVNVDATATNVDWDHLQGRINRAVRRGLSAEDQRAYLRAVDVRVGAYREPWEMGESRFVANSNRERTMQHRRAYLEPHTGKRPNGSLVKRWPAEAGDAIDSDVCELGERRSNESS